MKPDNEIHPDRELEFWRSGRLGKKGRRARPQIVFGQVREDTAAERELFAATPRPRRALVVASGGCTALSLLTLAAPGEGTRVCAVDVNPAQVWLTELKAAVLRKLPPEQVATAFDRDARDAYRTVRADLTFAAREFFDRARPDRLLRHGLDGCGRVETVLRRVVRPLLFTTVHRRTAVRAMLGRDDITAQRRAYRAGWDTWRWRLALSVAFNPRALGLIYGRAARDTLPPRFAWFVDQRFRRAFARFPAAGHAGLWQTLLGEPPPDPAARPPHRDPALAPGLRGNLAAGGLETVADDVLGWLRRQPARSVGFFALSNILELVRPGYREELARELARVGRPGAAVCLRSIRPARTPLPEPGPLRRDVPAGERLSAADRSLFCHSLAVYRVV